MEKRMRDSYLVIIIVVCMLIACVPALLKAPAVLTVVLIAAALIIGYNAWIASSCKRALREAQNAENAAQNTAPDPAPVSRTVFASIPASKTVTIKIVGVTFENDDGSKRQELIRSIEENGGPDYYRFWFEEYEFEDEPAIGLFFDDDDSETRQLGNVSRSDLPRFLKIIDNITGVDVEITGGESVSYGLRATVEYDVI